MSASIRLIHPIYLDVPMLVSFAAAIEGGLSFGAEVMREKSHATNADASIAGKLGLSSLFSRFLDASVQGQVTAGRNDRERSLEKETRAHTEASVAILLYDRLRRDGGYIVDPTSLEEVTQVEPGALVEVAGTIEKNAIDAVIDTIDAIVILSKMATPERALQETHSTGGKTRQQASRKAEAEPIHGIRLSLDSDRKRTPISNALLRCSVPEGATAIVTLRTANLRDLTLSELHKNSVRVLGKVTRVVPAGRSVSPFENYGMALMKPAKLREVFDSLSSNEDMVAEFGDVEVVGPAVQLLPLMVFV